MHSYEEFDYDEFDEETKKYLNKAMDIYATIKDKTIEKKVDKLTEKKLYLFTKMDKKILSLYIAAFLVDGELKNIISSRLKCCSCDKKMVIYKCEE